MNVAQSTQQGGSSRPPPNYQASMQQLVQTALPVASHASSAGQRTLCGAHCGAPERSRLWPVQRAWCRTSSHTQHFYCDCGVSLLALRFEPRSIHSAHCAADPPKLPKPPGSLQGLLLTEAGDDRWGLQEAREAHGTWTDDTHLLCLRVAQAGSAECC